MAGADRTVSKDNVRRRLGVLGQVLIIGAVGLVAGFMAGLLGVGGGILMVPALLYFLRDQIPNMNVAVGTSMAIIVPVAIVGTITHASGGRVNWTVVVTIAAFSMCGSALGSYVSGMLSAVMLRRIFAVLLMVVAARMFLSSSSAGKTPEPKVEAASPASSIE
jgi:uncharacterized membrane protein YfcA